ncbi:MAG: hypothetical protein IK152_01685 [Lachnospiraceae bacterium]|nr:hypothetical protein [Lachnospiraceae bacterium]
MNGFKRKGTIINRKFLQFLLPTVLSTIAISLNEFVDSIIVAQLLGSRAMSMVNMACPVMLLFAIVFTLLGVGGSVVYAEYSGKQELEKADKVLNTIMVVAVVTALVLLVAGLLLLSTLAHAMCREESLIPEFMPYLRVLIISGVIIIPLQVFITFVPSMGRPGIGTAINITANAVNLLFDYIYIRYFNTGLQGAALATLSGYIVGLILGIILGLVLKLRVRFSMVTIKELKELPEVLSRGAASAVNQLGYCIKIFPKEIVMDVRSLGKPFDVTTAEDEAFSNVDVLRKIATSIDYGYVLGMNQTRIKISTGVSITEETK